MPTPGTPECAREHVALAACRALLTAPGRVTRAALAAALATPLPADPVPPSVESSV